MKQKLKEKRKKANIRGPYLYIPPLFESFDCGDKNKQSKGRTREKGRSKEDLGTVWRLDIATKGQVDKTAINGDTKEET